MCKDTFGKQAINWRSMTPCLLKRRVKNDVLTAQCFLFFPFFLMGEDKQFLPFLPKWLQSSQGRLSLVFGGNRRSCQSVNCRWWSPSALGEPWRKKMAGVHELINGSAGTSCQNLTLIVKHQALLGFFFSMNQFQAQIYQNVTCYTLLQQLSFSFYGQF